MICDTFLGIKFYPFLYVCHNVHLSIHTLLIWFPLNNLSSPEANHLKFMHKIRDDKSFISDFTLFPFWNYAPVYFS